ncbi:hypothetical protein [Kitasatospora purpeofusca]|uniref:hypothetical protein n=1 Tax=Kitasatospora purpeofusca TaxID=67352 RepID=UPI00365D1F74
MRRPFERPGAGRAEAQVVADPREAALRAIHLREVKEAVLYAGPGMFPLERGA